MPSVINQRRGFFIGRAKPKGQKSRAKVKSGDTVLGEGAASPSPPAMGLGGSLLGCELPRAPTAPRFSTIFSAQDDLS